MRYSWHIVTMLLAVVVAVLTVSSLFDRDLSSNEELVDEKELILNSIMTRSSVRSFTEKEVPEDVMESILRAGMAAPTAGNRQPWEFYVVRDTSILRQFPSVTKFADPMAQHVRVAIIACGVPSESFPLEPLYWVQDVSAATENILLATHALGLGAVWCGVYPGEDRVATLRKLLDVPDGVVPFNIIFLGYPDSAPTIKDKWKPEKVHYVL